MTASQDRQWLIERVALGEAPAGAELTPSEQSRLRELTGDDAAIRAAYPSAEVAAEIRRRQRVARVTATAERRRRLATFVAPAVAVTAAVALFVRVGTAPVGETDPEPEVTRLKGAALVVHRKTPDGSDLLRTGDTAAAGDRIQLGFRLDRAAFAVLLSLDGRGVVTVHLPDEGQSSPAELEAGAGQLPFSYELDDAPGFERFILVTAEHTFSLAEVRQAAARLAAAPPETAVQAALDLPEGLAQLDFVLMKGDLQ